MSDFLWMVPPNSHVPHAFRRADLEAGAQELTALRHCGTWPVGELREDEFTERCRPCQLAVTELERTSPDGFDLIVAPGAGDRPSGVGPPSNPSPCEERRPMSRFITYASTSGITVDTPIELHDGNPNSVAITIGPNENITLEFGAVEALERLRDLANKGIPALRAKLRAVRSHDEHPPELRDAQLVQPPT